MNRLKRMPCTKFVPTLGKILKFLLVVSLVWANVIQAATTWHAAAASLPESLEDSHYRCTAGVLPDTGNSAPCSLVDICSFRHCVASTGGLLAAEPSVSRYCNGAEPLTLFHDRSFSVPPSAPPTPPPRNSTLPAVRSLV